ncbi:MAG: DUF1800 domain-containing protein [Candidatus Sumerlaeaceae bacterium]|nr:DUF1800 domain-containing protein [Candidatus Sumerlaeaceae bacterium]
MIGPRRDFFAQLAVPLSAGLAKIADPAAGQAPEPSLAWHAANRLMFGPRPGEVAAIEQMGYEAFLEQQLSPETIDDSACDAAIAALNPVTYAETWQQLYDRRDLPDWNEVWRPLRDVQHATAIRMVMSKRQLYERLVEFWHNHFNIFGWDYIIRSMFTKWDLTIRQHALGNFRALLEATAKHPCMLYYLDNYLSTNAGPNENYARELFELHTLGAIHYRSEGGYVDNDVYEASRCFTGWTFETGDSAPTRGEFKYIRANHDRFQKIVLGRAIPNDQADLVDGRIVLDLLAYHPGTAKFICWKLCQRLVDDNPPPSLVASSARVFQRAASAPDQIRQVVRHICRSPEFQSARIRKFVGPQPSAPSIRAAKFKRPLDWAVSVMRALGMAFPLPEPDFDFTWYYDPMGMPMFGWRPPNGPPDVWDEWATSNNFLYRQRFVFIAASNCHDSGYTGPFRFNSHEIMPPTIRTPRQIAQFWLNRILQRPPSEATAQAVLDFVADGRGYDIPLSAEQIRDKAPETAALCTMTPEFMRR